jgi:methylmalonyl-CoA mutase cobalamin-binding domain/chain
LTEATLDKIADAIANVDSQSNLSGLIEQALHEQTSAVDIIERGLRKGLQELGRKYEAGEFFLSELLYGASMIDESMKLLAPHMTVGRLEAKGRIVLGTVRGDIHDIGKNIFKLMADANGFEVYDLGVDVSPEEFLKAVIEKDPHVLGLSALLTTTISEMATIIEALKKAGVRDKLKVLLGGNAVTESFGKEIGADAAAHDAVQGIDFCSKWVKR